MKPKLLDSALLLGNVAAGLILKTDLNKELVNTEIESDSLKNAIDIADASGIHILDQGKHLTQIQKNEWSESTTKIDNHLVDNISHITQEEKDKWNDSETETGSTTKMNIVQSNLNAHKENVAIHITQQEKNVLHDKYTKSEMDNIVSGLMTESMYKPSVASFEDLIIEYPDAEVGWLAVVDADGVTYRYDGVQWKGFSNDTIPLATETLDGKMSSLDYIKLKSVEAGANNYQHPTGSQNNHVTDNQIEYWNDKAANETVTTKKDGIMDHYDKIKLDGVDSGANNYLHPDLHDAAIIKESINKQFVSASQKETWNNKASLEIATTSKNGLLSKELYIKLENIDAEANKYVHPLNHSLDMMIETPVYKLVTLTEKSAWNDKETIDGSQLKSDIALQSAKAYIDTKLLELAGMTVGNAAYHKETLYYSNWTTYPSYFVYKITLLNVVNCANISIGVDLAATPEQLSFIKTCNLKIASTENDTIITLRSDILPVLNLPILLVFGTSVN